MKKKGRPLSKPKYTLLFIVNSTCEGKVKRTFNLRVKRN